MSHIQKVATQSHFQNLPRKFQDPNLTTVDCGVACGKILQFHLYIWQHFTDKAWFLQCVWSLGYLTTWYLVWSIMLSEAQAQ